MSGLKAIGVGNKKVRISWTKNSVADGYLIYAQKNGKYGYVGMTSNSYYIDSKALDTTYNFYWVFPYVLNESNKMITGSCPNYVYSKGICLAVQNLKASSVKGGVKL